MMLKEELLDEREAVAGIDEPVPWASCQQAAQRWRPTNCSSSDARTIRLVALRQPEPAPWLGWRGQGLYRPG